MSLVKSRELFIESAFPIAVDRVIDRTLIQKELHRHEYFEMLYVEHGTLINRFKGDEISMKAGNLLIMKPYVLHVLNDERRGARRKAYVCSFLPQIVDFSIQSLEELESSKSPNRYYFKPMLSMVEEGVSAVILRVDPERRDRVVELLNALINSTRAPDERSHAQARHHFLALMLLLTEQYEQSEDLSRTVHRDLAVPVSRYQAGLRKTLNHIHDHFDEPLSLDGMAAMSGASETYFCRLFKHETGMTFLNYVNSLRIERACVLLRDTCNNALDICYEVGFNDYTHFGRQFKKSMGLSPAEYRKQKLHIRNIRET